MNKPPSIASRKRHATASDYDCLLSSIMTARSFESPMDWEYENRGPLDPTSPFAQAARDAQQNGQCRPRSRSGEAYHVSKEAKSQSNDELMPLAGSGSPFKNVSRPPNPFARLQTPLKSSAPPPQTAKFTPQLSSKNAAPPFRNPAFTTPRRPVDEVAFSEASGAEDSPALTEASDYPNDTPDIDHRADAIMGGTISPLKIDKQTRYARSANHAKKHSSGKGEIRSHRDVNSAMRKRKRRNMDKDVGSVARRYGYDVDSDFDSDDSDDRVSRASSRSKGGKPKEKGTFESFFYALNKYPHTPDHMQRWMQLGANVFLISVLTYVSWSVVSTIRNDIYTANAAARQELVSRMTECQTEYTINECAKKDRPALKAVCDQWYDCMTQDPEAIMRVKVTAKQVAEILNEFTEAMHLKAWVSDLHDIRVGLTCMQGVVLAIVLVCTTVNFGTFSRHGGSKDTHPAPSQPAKNSIDGARSPGITPGYMLVPVQTPRMQRQTLLDEGTDTDNSPINSKPYHTPSTRRSPSKSDRQLSPVKYGRSPSKGY